MKENLNLGRLMSMTVKFMLKRLAKSFEEAGLPISAEEFVILKVVSSTNNIIQQDLAEILNKDKSAVLRNVNQLEEKIWLARIPDSKDKRRNIMVITKQGLELLEKANLIHKEVFKGFLKGVSEEELDTFVHVLTTIQNNAKI